MDDWAKDTLDRLLTMTALFENDEDRLTINISGTHYEINALNLFNFPDTMLGDPLKRVRYLVPGTNDYFFPRHSSSFEAILYYYMYDGVLIKPETVPAMIFYEEIRFFQLGNKLIQTFYNDYLSINEENVIEPKQKWKRFLWQTFAHPPLTYSTHIFNAVSAIINALAIYSLCLETISAYRHIHPSTWLITHPVKPSNRTEGFQCAEISLRPYHYILNSNSENSFLEIICVTWFYVELFIRTCSTPSWTFLIHDPNFALDILSILPIVLNHVFYRIYFPQLSTSTKETQLFDYFTCLKLFRLFRLTRHAKCLEIFMKVLYVNLKDLLMLTVLINFGMFYFGLTQFVLEQINAESEINSIGEALWHGFTVIITVGYSDIAEYQFLSYSLAIVGVWYGAISMAIVLPSITQSYNIFHNLQFRRHLIKYKIN